MHLILLKCWRLSVAPLKRMKKLVLIYSEMNGPHNEIHRVLNNGLPSCCNYCPSLWLEPLPPASFSLWACTQSMPLYSVPYFNSLSSYPRMPWPLHSLFPHVTTHGYLWYGLLLCLTILSGDGPAALAVLLPPPTKTPLELVMIFLFRSPSSPDDVFLLIQLVQAPIDILYKINKLFNQINI